MINGPRLFTVAPHLFLYCLLLFNIPYPCFVTEFTKAVITFLFIRPCGREDSTNWECCSKMTTLPHHPNVSTTPHLVHGVIFFVEGQWKPNWAERGKHYFLWSNNDSLFYFIYFTMQVLLYVLKFWLSFQLLPPRQVWTTNIPPKCLPIWHCVSVDPGGGQRLEACHHHQTGLNTSFSTASLPYSYQQWRWLFFFSCELVHH